MPYLDILQIDILTLRLLSDYDNILTNPFLARNKSILPEKEQLYLVGGQVVCRGRSDSSRSCSLEPPLYDMET